MRNPDGVWGERDLRLHLATHDHRPVADREGLDFRWWQGSAIRVESLSVDEAERLTR